MELTGKVALITGSAHRLGRAMACALAGDGADVAVHHHRAAEAAAETVEKLKALGVRAASIQADLTDPVQIARLFREHDEIFGHLDVLVNSAAVFQRKAFPEIDVADWDRVMNLNLRGPFLCSQQAAQRMKRAGAGLIVNIADVAAFQGWPGYAHYCVSKAGLVALTRVLARILAPEIRVNAIAPGPVLPPSETTAEEQERLAKLTALGRVGSPDDVCRALRFLVGSDYVTGETIVVDGGKLARS